MKHYFKKAYPQMKLRDEHGEILPFDALNLSWCFLDLDDTHEDPKYKRWIDLLNNAIKAGKHGVERLSEGQWSELYVQKKTPNYKRNLPDFLGGLGGDGRAALRSGNSIAPDSAGKRADLAEVQASKNQPHTPEEAEARVIAKANPTQAPKPTVGKLPKAAATE